MIKLKFLICLFFRQSNRQLSQYQQRGLLQPNYNNQNRDSNNYQQDQFQHHSDVESLTQQKNQKSKPDYEQIFGRSKPVDTANKYLEIQQKMDQEEKEEITVKIF